MVVLTAGEMIRSTSTDADAVALHSSRTRDLRAGDAEPVRRRLVHPGVVL
jgi:hypothetical protein